MRNFRIILLFLGVLFLSPCVRASIPVNISYYKIYDFMDELATEGLIQLNSASKPYSREFITRSLSAINKDQLNSRQKAELDFFLKSFGFSLPEKKTTFLLTPPSIVYSDSLFKVEMSPILGMTINSNDANTATRRWWGADFQSRMGKHISLWGSLRDISNGGELLSKSSYLNHEPGFEYTVGTDYSDSRGGISYSGKWLDLSFQKEQIMWGDNYHGANILSGRAPSFPMIYLKLKPVSWFELDYFHAWLVSNLLDSTRYYLENEITKFYRPANKFMAANLLTFFPWKHTSISIGNSIIYAESSPIAGYFIPLAMYKSIDHSLTKGTRTENQNSQIFLNLSSRYIKHLHLYASLFFDEIQYGRFLPGSEEKNPGSIKLGFRLQNLAVQNLALTAEFTRTNIITYKHSIPLLAYSSNSYNLGNFLGDNSEELYISIQYKPIRNLDINLSYNLAQHGNEYIYFRRGYIDGVYGKIDNIIAYPSPGDIIWKNSSISLKGTYELMKNTYMVLGFEQSNVQAWEPTAEVRFGETRMTQQETLDRFTPGMYQGKHLTVTAGLSFGF